MAVNFPPLAPLLPIAGVRLATLAAHIKAWERDDVTLIELAPGATCAGVFTRNAFCAAPVTLCRQHLAQTAPRYWLINAGNANAGTGAAGMQDALACCASLASLGDCAPQAVLPFSTGVIGQRLPAHKIQAVLPAAVAALATDHWTPAAHAIMTTDTVPKGISLRFEIEGHPCQITGITKGAGMIRPDLATMLAFIATDAAVAAPLLQHCLEQAVNQSFNRISIDGDTSTNDACVLAATGRSGAPLLTEANSPGVAALQQALTQVCVTLAQLIVRDGEGATKFITVAVEGGATQQECLDVAYTIAHSPLVKTAFFASDANWGRILAAVGRAGLVDLDLNAIAIYLGEVCIVRDGGVAPDYTEAQGQAVMAASDIQVRVVLGRGDQQTQVWTCDFSYDYVRINAEYRT